MDLARFISLLASRSLYFACSIQFQDPYEGLLPRSHTEALSQPLQGMVSDFLLMKTQLEAMGADTERLNAALVAIPERVAAAERESASCFGVSCWHESEYESDAMWKLYSVSGQGIAIESSVGRLKAAIGERKDLVVERVRYADFEHDGIEKGHRHYHLSMKRKCFEHEKEVRAMIHLPEQGKGVAIPCDLDVLVSSVYVSPLVETYAKDAVVALCSGTGCFLNKPIHQSSLYRAPDYTLSVSTK